MRRITPSKIAHHISLRFSRILSLCLFLHRGGFRDSLGSYISPRALAIANDNELYEKLFPIMNLLKIQETGSQMIRLGSDYDGGYVVLSKDYSRSFLISAGISTNNDFERDFALLGGHGHQVDYTVTEAPEKHHNLSFSPSRLVGASEKTESFDVTLDELYRKFIQGTHYEGQPNVLKMDIEGSEWDVLNSCAVIEKFDQILLEIHYLERLGKEHFQTLYLSTLQKLLSKFAPIAIAGNNCCGFVTIGGFSLPRVLEMTLVNRATYGYKLHPENQTQAPLITRNYAARAPIVLKHW